MLRNLSLKQRKPGIYIFGALGVCEELLVRIGRGEVHPDPSGIASNHRAELEYFKTGEWHVSRAPR